ncbi:MAG: potassium transporter TrkA [Anaerolineaceae bacterium]|nr:potassium transporter TrkA [Anaerolineaceae bacterium]
MQLVILTISFFFVALAAKKIGQWFSQVGLPYITGYLLAGMVAGPFILNLIPEGASTDLRFIDEISLAVIAFVAGSELYLKEIRSRLKSISWVTGSVMLVTLVLSGVALYLLTDIISFTRGMETTSRIAVAVLGSTILLALSPASTIAVIKEVRAKGSFTATVLGITVTMDVVIILLFAVSVAISSALLTGLGFSASFALLLFIDLAAAILAGWLVGKMLQAVLGTSLKSYFKIALLLLIGFAVFASAFWLVDYSHDNLPLEIHIEPLLVAMIAGFYVTNFTNFRDEFASLLHDVGPAVYVAFFTLTGVALKLDILLATLPVALALFVVRGGGIAIGSYLGGRAAGEPASFNRYAWMGLITQAGIALGLAREVAVEFPALGDAFATLVISVVVLNEIFGPMFLKSALRRAGETNLPMTATADEVRDVLILGIEAQSIELARQLQAANWQVILADTNRDHVERLSHEDLSEHYLPVINEETLAELIDSSIDAVVAMLPDDEENLNVAELSQMKFGVKRPIVRPNALNMVEKFTEMGALVLDPASAMVSLLNQSVRSPQTAAVLLHQDSGREMVQVTVSNRDVDGLLVRDLRLPNDVLFVDLTRNGSSIVPHGYTRVRLQDEVTLIGKASSLEEATLKLGY